ncbi:unnamed protein product [Hymenolepis diminuta]|uniref:Uncharacterized protein n=1 Tax=Hymenolepis diminuta TaxID=6216 RepID=A0A564YHV3_HYMDI|nr:unnamed protein product [Hymenolepis diminuta]VUZ46107.1 unnamed protein product [Hymenolepis diminuta]VUZ56431.1 unnamed protein product [Hymenolepis diminuta]VUZ56434.1 unnamed protein product [Hymenolepis diminuta]
MFNEAEPGVNAVAATLTYSIFDLRNPYVWFQQSENGFQLRCITKQKAMYQIFFFCFSSKRHQKTTLTTRLKEATLIVSLILRRDVYNKCYRKLT